MKYLFVTLLLFPMLRVQAAIYMQPGESKNFFSKENVWVENGSVVRISDQGSGFSVRGQKLGSSLVRIGKEEIQIYIVSSDFFKTENKLQPLIQKSIGLELHRENGELVVQGRLVRWQDWKALAEACKNKNCQYHMRASMHSQLLQIAEKEIREQLKRMGLPSINLNQGEVRISEKSPHFLSLQSELSAYGINVSKDSTALDLAPLVRVHITVAEIKKEASLNYGIKWPASYNAQLLPKVSDSGETQLLSLQLLEKTGHGKILASPNLLCRSGKEAEFLAGGEFPIKVLNYKFQDVIWKKYGIVLKVKPLADHSGRMSISLETEVSSIDSSRTVDGIPGLYTNRIQSHFDLSESRTIALSGLIKSEQGRSSEGVPGIKNIPILGSLFASKDWRENRTELVIFVKPEIVNPSEENLPSTPNLENSGEI